MKEPVFIDLAIALLIHQEQIEAFGGGHGLRDQNSLESALGQARHTWNYTQDIFETAAQYCYSLARNHPFVDGNKRIAAACMLVFLDINGYEPDYSVEDVFIWTMEVAVGSLSREELAERLRY
ncbi:MAG: type II toxin-antitoxin system death-on-curing family toxin [Mariprofundaceae bacterium]|nr:type II toxin-antitoxin system death-on-curing family toxin [Mariprofundaceae bacterium]